MGQNKSKDGSQRLGEPSPSQASAASKDDPQKGLLITFTRDAMVLECETPGCKVHLQAHWSVCPACHRRTGFANATRLSKDFGSSSEQWLWSNALEIGSRPEGARNMSQRLDELSRCKKEFLSRVGAKYGYNGKLENELASDFSRLKGFTYFDSTGSALYAERAVKEFALDLQCTIHGNPHTSSDNQVGGFTAKGISELRNEILEFFHADPNEYKVIFTKGASQGAKLVAENFCWAPGSVIAQSQTNHNSFLGVRTHAVKAGATLECIADDELRDYVDSSLKDASAPSLLVYPAACNFSGEKFPLDLVRSAQARENWNVLLDVAAYVPTARLDLRKTKPAFCCVSWYKLFGFPTGVGSLIVRRDAMHLLTGKTFFGGGSVTLASPFENKEWRSMEEESSYEDGTLSFLELLGLRASLHQFRRISIADIGQHVHTVTQELYRRLARAKHGTGQSVAIIYGRHDANDFAVQGSVLACNFKRPDGRIWSPVAIGRMLALCNVHARVGQFCNPGAAARCLGLGPKDIETLGNRGYACGTAGDFVDSNHERPSMAIRLSVGYMSSFEDVMTIMTIVENVLIDFNPDSLTTTAAEAPITINLNKDWHQRMSDAGKVSYHLPYEHLADLFLMQDSDHWQTSALPKGRASDFAFACCPLNNCIKHETCLLMARACSWNKARAIPKINPKEFR